MLEMRGISKAYGAVRANDRIDLTVPRGGIVGLLGANGSGKSTLMKCLFGMERPDAGGIIFKGRELDARTPRDAIRAGIGMIHQHFTLVDAMTVADNVMLGWERTGRWLDAGAVAAQVARASREYGLDVDPRARVGALALGTRQRVEIVKALVRGCDLLILDEPTSILAPPEVARLLELMRRLKAEGKSVIFISHKLGEVLEVCDEIVVLREGRVAGRQAASGATRAGLSRLMVGSEPTNSDSHPRPAPGGTCCSVTNLVVKDAVGVQRVNGVSFELRTGEVLAIAGVDGNGQAELADALAGLVAPVSGSIERRGELAYIPADRATTSLVQSMSVADNLRLRDYWRAGFSRRGFLNSRFQTANAREKVSSYDIRCADIDAPIRTLSGGNQQKVVIAREFGRNPAVLIAFQPAWGLDPAATRFVLDRVLELRARGGAVLYISSELEEVLEVGDRIGVLYAGRLIDLMPRAEATMDRLGLALSGSTAAPLKAA